MKRRKLLPVTFNGETAHTSEDIKRIFGVNYSTFKMRVSRGGMTPEDAVSTSDSLKPGSRAFKTGTVKTLKYHGYVIEKLADSEAIKYRSALQTKTRWNRKLGQWAHQHRIVWCRHIGRDLRDGENVHHINGDRADNRPENLELWSVNQPAGQRVKDKVQWARNILSMYGDEYPE